MIATLTSKGQITIPLVIRERLRLKAGDKLNFDENAPFLKANKIISEEEWENFGSNWVDPWPEKSAMEVLDVLRDASDTV